MSDRIESLFSCECGRRMSLVLKVGLFQAHATVLSRGGIHLATSRVPNDQIVVIDEVIDILKNTDEWESGDYDVAITSLNMAKAKLR